MLGTLGRSLNIVGCAYSNLFYPELRFWADLPIVTRVIREIVDIYRRQITKRSDYWILETEVLKERAVGRFSFPVERVGVVPMAVSSLVGLTGINAEARRRFCAQMPSAFRFLYLCGSSHHKRLHALPAIAASLAGRGIQRVCFVTTIDPRQAYSRTVSRAFDALGQSEALCNVGPVPPTEVATLIDCCDAMGTFSTLESFSNNFVEAWAMRKPLVVTDAEWARRSCGDAAVYVNPEDAASSADVLGRIVTDVSERERLVNNGDRRIREFPDARKKAALYIEEIRHAVESGRCPHEDRKLIWRC
jgi:glycosyltransferase involved in cell wall biosynthesis